MDAKNKRLLIFAAIGLVAVLLILVLVTLSTGGDPDDAPGGPGADRDRPGAPGGDGGYWSDAPSPVANMEELDVYRRLWPDIEAPAVDREEVERQWRDFAAVHPENVYIPPQFQPQRSESEIEEIRATVDAVASVESQLANRRAEARGATPGQDGPDAPAEPTVTPEEQRRYFSFKIQELESRIQLIEYTIQQQRMPADQLPQARADLETWRRELAELQEVAEQVP